MRRRFELSVSGFSHDLIGSYDTMSKFGFDGLWSTSFDTENIVVGTRIYTDLAKGHQTKTVGLQAQPIFTTSVGCCCYRPYFFGHLRKIVSWEVMIRETVLMDVEVEVILMARAKSYKPMKNTGFQIVYASSPPFRDGH